MTKITNAISKPTTTATTCPYCGVGCGVDITTNNNRATSVAGSTDHPANFGRLCIKGSNLLATTTPDGRLLQPMVNGQASDWDSATALIAKKFTDTIRAHGPHSVAFYLSGQLLTEDYYVANKLMKGYLGSANIDTNSRLCMSSAVAGHKRAFGEDLVPGNYQDLELTELVVFIGSNAAWTHPVLFQRIEQAKQKNLRLQVVIIDPRRTASAELADLHLAVKPGTDAAIFTGLLHFLHRENLTDQAFINDHTNHFDDCIRTVEHWNIANTAEFCGLSEQSLTQFFQLFGQAKTAVSFYSQGINQSSSGVDKSNAIINCHLATGKIGKAGCGPFSVTGQPNAMGGREVGGMANMLAAHMDIENPAHRALVQSFWQAPTMADKPGYKAVELFDNVANGNIKALWIMATNPLVSLPNHTVIEQALTTCEFVVVSDIVASNDTVKFADVQLPACAWSEKNGTVTNSERRISRQRGVIAPPGQARPDWQIICEVAKAMGFTQGFNFQNAQQIFVEHARLTGHQNAGQRALDLSALANLSVAQYDNLRPVQWPVNQRHPEGCARLFTDGQFFTANKKANFINITPARPQQSTCAQFPFALTSGRIRDQWHSMAQTGKISQLSEHTKYPQLTINPADAKKLHLQPGDLVKITSTIGAIFLPANICPSVGIGQLFVPIHWSHEFASSASINRLFASVVDPLSGQPELKHAPVQLEKVAVAQYALVYSPTPLADFIGQLPKDCHWVRYQGGCGWVYRLTLATVMAGFSDAVKIAIASTAADKAASTEFPLEWLSYQHQGQLRLAALNQGQFHGFVFLSAQIMTIEDNWINELLSEGPATLAQINAVLQGRAPVAKGRKICSCFDVYQQDIIAAIEADQLTSVEQITQKLRCGSNCGSCKTELSCLLRTQLTQGELSGKSSVHAA